MDLRNVGILPGHSLHGITNQKTATWNITTSPLWRLQNSHQSGTATNVARRHQNRKCFLFIYDNLISYLPLNYHTSLYYLFTFERISLRTEKQQLEVK